MNRCKGNAILNLIIFLSVILIVVEVIPDYLPADAADVQALSKAAASNEPAKAALVEALKANPNPSRGQLRQIKQHVDELLLVAASREVTGDATLPAPSELRARDAKLLAERESQIQSKDWSGMTDEEKTWFLEAKYGYALIFLSIILVPWVVLKAFLWRFRG
ncbi:hypothetical protein AACH06_25615 [Ideonella sp. DXS29W]|uniref:Uncharacterized protein n=1 Tax=Ideonella lacteola TaxID=2984193 RepID=A0ABU9BWU2_9BURK